MQCIKFYFILVFAFCFSYIDGNTPVQTSYLPLVPQCWAKIDSKIYGLHLYDNIVKGKMVFWWFICYFFLKFLFHDPSPQNALPGNAPVSRIIITEFHIFPDSPFHYIYLYISMGVNSILCIPSAQEKSNIPPSSYADLFYFLSFIQITDKYHMGFGIRDMHNYRVNTSTHLYSYFTWILGSILSHPWNEHPTQGPATIN